VHAGSPRPGVANRLGCWVPSVLRILAAHFRADSRAIVGHARFSGDSARLYVVGERAVLLFAAINLLLRAVTRQRSDAQR
jgi:hypothetical protein